MCKKKKKKRTSSSEQNFKSNLLNNQLIASVSNPFSFNSNFIFESKIPFLPPKLDALSQVEEDSLLRNDLRPANKLAKGNKLFMRFATKGK